MDPIGCPTPFGLPPEPPLPPMPFFLDPEFRTQVRDATISAVYRNVRSDAAAAASAQDWNECHRLKVIARSIEVAYPDVSARARFPQPVVTFGKVVRSDANNEL